MRVRAGVRGAAGGRRRGAEAAVRAREDGDGRDGPYLGTTRCPGGGLQDQPGGGVGQREPDLGFAWAVYMWASGRTLDEVLREAEMPAGDFVRWCKQVIDVLGQIAAAAPPGAGAGSVARTARKATDAVLRGLSRTARWGDGVCAAGSVDRALGGAPAAVLPEPAPYRRT